MATLAATLIVLNEEAYIGRALQNVKHLATEIVVVDGGSTDSTIAICEQHGCRVIRRPFEFDFAAQRNIAHGSTTCDWTLTIDADEYFSDAALSAISEIVKADDQEFSAYSFLRMNYIDNVLIDKNYQLRLLRRKHTAWSGRLHETVTVMSGKTMVLPSDSVLIHFKDGRRQSYSNKLYGNMMSGNTEFPNDDFYSFSSRTGKRPGPSPND